MKKINFVGIFLLLSGISLMMITCKHEIPAILPPPIPTPTPTCSADTTYFVNEIFPFINSNCADAGCHNMPTMLNNRVSLRSYDDIMKYIVPKNPAGSKIYEMITKTTADRMPYGRPPLTSAQIDAIKKWIEQGALNNQCTSSCDITTGSVITYTNTISKTINTYCKGCHNPANLAPVLNGNVDLSSYDAVKKQAINDNLIAVISHAAGFPAMPQGFKKLSDCQIAQIQKWKDDGCPQ